MTTENTLALSGKKAVVAGGISGIGPKADRRSQSATRSSAPLRRIKRPSRCWLGLPI